MTAFRDMIIDIQEEIERGELSFRQIAIKYEVDLQAVESLACDLVDELEDTDLPLDDYYSNSEVVDEYNNYDRFEVDDF